MNKELLNKESVKTLLMAIDGLSDSDINKVVVLAQKMKEDVSKRKVDEV